MKEIFIFSFFLFPCLIEAYKIQNIPISSGYVVHLSAATYNYTFYMDGSEISSSTLEFSTTTNGISILFYCFTQNDPNLDSTIKNCEFKQLSSNRTEKPSYSTLVNYYEVFIDKQFFIVRFTGSPTLNIISLRAKSNDNTNTNNNNKSTTYYSFDEVDIIFISLISVIFLIILIYIIIFLCKRKKAAGDVSSEPTHPSVADSTLTYPLGEENKNNYPTYYV